MSKLKSRLLVFAGLLVAIGIAGYFFLPTAHCCDEDDPESAALVSAANAGKMEAIQALFERAQRDKIPALEENWALIGALRGDQKMRQTYVSFYRTRLSSEQRSRVLSYIGGVTDMPGKPCLLADLTETSSTGGACN
ncbi:hypothetical protein [Caenimonas aquaedulcis]|uniref:Uncharacterized protein n=1 Tax=Caenimonas aquaedulcis TaxID=2793270 RepID=A0A931H167_9BURK|nr:hypothetical protein [Caenimonas aquaedulcis]MBG9386648.1 hypothetical protein [Caenimonas aquaedulcis]